MTKKSFLFGCSIAIISLLMSFQSVLAHESVTAGNYSLEVGWLSEPPIVGQQNAVVVNVFDTSNGNDQPVEDVSSLIVTISYGGQNKILTLQPLGEDTPGQFIAPILPTVAGQYTVILGGKLGDTVVNSSVNPEEVQPASTLQFPSTDSSQQGNSAIATWLIWLSILIGLVGIGVGVTALRKASTR